MAIESHDDVEFAGPNFSANLSTSQTVEETLNILLPKVTIDESVGFGDVFPIFDENNVVSPWDVQSRSTDDSMMGDEPFIFSGSPDIGSPTNFFTQLNVLSNAIPKVHEDVLTGSLTNGINLFTPSNIERFFTLYFRHW